MEWFDILKHAADSALRSIMGMRPRFVLRRALPLRLTRSTRSPVPELVKSRPLRLDETFLIADDHRAADEMFVHLRRAIFEDCDALSTAARQGNGGRTIFRETGTTAEGRAFLFFKPYNDYGWLIERSGAGWRVSRAEKIVRQQMFLRSNADPWDIVLVFADPMREGSFRVRSHRFGNALMAYPVYEQRMREAFCKELLGFVG